jgi:hypothetical protein
MSRYIDLPLLRVRQVEVEVDVGDGVGGRDGDRGDRDHRRERRRARDRRLPEAPGEDGGGARGRVLGRRVVAGALRSPPPPHLARAVRAAGSADAADLPAVPVPGPGGGVPRELRPPLRARAAVRGAGGAGSAGRGRLGGGVHRRQRAVEPRGGRDRQLAGPAAPDLPRPGPVPRSGAPQLGVPRRRAVPRPAGVGGRVRQLRRGDRDRPGRARRPPGPRGARPGPRDPARPARPADPGARDRARPATAAARGSAVGAAGRAGCRGHPDQQRAGGRAGAVVLRVPRPKDTMGRCSSS